MNGLRALVDDKSCIEMENCIVEGGVADIYIEDPTVVEPSDDGEAAANVSDFENEMEAEEDPTVEIEDDEMEAHDLQSQVLVCRTKSREEVEKQIKFVKEWYSPSKIDKGKQVQEQVLDDTISDSDFLPGDDSPSEDDEEGNDIHCKFKQFKKKMKGGQVADLDDVILDSTSMPAPVEIEDDGDVTPYDNSSAAEGSSEDMSSRKYQMYPIAWAVVEKENNESWDWFCYLLFRDVLMGDGTGWVIISDQQKGIINAVSFWAPQAEHRNCARHIYANWRKTYKTKEWQKLFWRCAKAPSVPLFNLARAKLAQKTKDGADAILKTSPEHWSRAYFRIGSNCDSVDNNICESFNKWIVEARFFPIISMLETIRRKVMVRIQEQRTKCDRWSGLICPNINKKMNSYIKLTANCEAISNGANKFEVKYFSTHKYTMDLNERKCSCRYWELSGLPCHHAISGEIGRAHV